MDTGILITMNKIIPVYQPNLDGNERNYVLQCLDSTWISSKGEFIERFERSFADYIGSPSASTVANGTVAIHLALMAAGIGPGDEVIVPSFTYVASVNPIVQIGAKPVFVDSLADTLQIDPQDVARKITPQTKAIMAVHLYGLPCDMDPLVELCHQHQLLLIEDCAEAFGTYYQGQHVGTFGDIATFSFFGNKTITTGEGGMVVSNHPQMIERANHLKNQGVSKSVEYWHDVVAYNYRMTNICAAIGVAQLERADEIIAKKRQIANWYKKYLTALPLIFHDELPNTTHSFWMCTVLLNDPMVRAPLREFMKASGIETRPLFPPCHQLPHLQTKGSFPVAEFISMRGMNLPSYPDLTQEDVRFVCETMKSYFDGINT
jgi:perosamine synthetase